MTTLRRIEHSATHFMRPKLIMLILKFYVVLCWYYVDFMLILKPKSSHKKNQKPYRPTFHINIDLVP